MRAKSIISVLLLFTISLFVYHEWISINIFTNSDWGFGYADTLKEYLSLHIWFSWGGFGSVDYLLWRTPVLFLEGLIGNAGFSSSVSDKFLIFWPTIILANLASFLLIKKIFKSDLAAF